MDKAAVLIIIGQFKKIIEKGVEHEKDTCITV